MTSPTEPRTGACRTCQAAIVWTVTNLGKAMPVDAEPDDTGNVLCENDDRLGRVAVRSTVYGPDTIVMAVGPNQWVTRSHFATCPQGKQWRHKK